MRIINSKLVFVLSSLFFFTNCKEPKNAVNNVSTIKTINKHYCTNLIGFWVSIEYYDELLKSKSPAVAYNSIPRFSSLVIQKESAMAEDLKIQYDIRQHEAAEGHIDWTKSVKKKNNEKECFATFTNDIELLVKLNLEDDILVLTFDKQKTEYFKLGESLGSSNVKNALKRVVYKELFFGQYLIGSSDSIDFFTNGEITGWEEYVGYDINLDYMTSIDDNDWLSLKKQNGELEYFDYIINGDTLFISSENLNYNLIKIM